MADKHILSLEIPAISNCELLCIKDTSQYSTELAIDCEELLITLPGYSVPVLIKVDSGFDMCLNACTLALHFIRTMIDAAVANVEYCQSSTQGMQLYNYAKQRLSKINCPSGNCGGSNPYII